MKPTDNPADPFKKALAEATKVLADDRRAERQLHGRPAGRVGRDHAPAAGQPPDDKARGAAGARHRRCLALQLQVPRRRHRALATRRRARWRATLYEAMEIARCEAVGATRDARHRRQHRRQDRRAKPTRKGYLQITKPPRRRWPSRGGLLIRHLPPAAPLPPGAGNVHGPVARLHRGPGRRHLRKSRRRRSPTRPPSPSSPAR